MLSLPNHLSKHVLHMYGFHLFKKKESHSKLAGLLIKLNLIIFVLP